MANIESEDWARTYRFQQVIWPTATTTTSADAQTNNDRKKAPTALSNLARAVANDLVVTEPNSSNNSKGRVNINDGTHKYADASRLIVGTGSSNERISTLFGKPFSGRLSPDNAVDEDTVFYEYGLIGATMNAIFQQLPKFSVCTVSVYEIIDEDVLHDLLAPVSSQHQAKGRNHTTLHVRQPRDLRGAIIEGLTECPIDSLESLRECLQPLHSTQKPKASKKVLFAGNSNHYHSCQGGHTIVAVKICQNGMEDDLHHSSRCATLTFVNLALPSSSPTDKSPRKSLTQQKSDRQTSFLRTSASTLFRILWGLLAREAGVNAIINYRESILTKVLQRQLEQPRSRVVMLASLSPLSDAYDGTLATLRYVERLLARPGLPKSPYGRILTSPGQGRASPDKGASCPSPHATSPSLEPQMLMEQFADKESILKSVITDPRQRLARFYRTQKDSNSSDDGLNASKENDDSDLQSWSIPRTPLNDPKVNIGSDDLSGIEDQSTVQEKESQLPVPSGILDDNPRLAKDHSHLHGQTLNVNMPETAYMSEVDPERFHPSRTDFAREVAKLESSVNRMMKDRNFAIWQSSSISIRYLKDFHFSQQQAMDELQQTMNDLTSQRDNALLAAKEAEGKQLQLLRDYNELGLAKDSELATMMETVKIAESDRADVEKIAEEAIAAQDTLEHAATELEQQLIHNQKISKATQFELESLAAAKEEGSEKLHQSKEEISALKSDLNEMRASVAELHVALKQSKQENEFMANRHAEDQEILAELESATRISSQQRIEQAKRDKQFKALETENMLLAKKIEAQSLEFSKALDEKEEALSKCRADLAKAREHLRMLQDQDEFAAKSVEASMHDLHFEVGDLRKMLAEEQQSKEDAFIQQKNGRRLNKEISDELESTRKELEQRILDVQELSVGLKQTIEERDSLKLALRDQEEALRGFQLQTRRKVHLVEKYRGTTATQLEEALEKNGMLIEVNEKLQLTVSQLQKERDEALRFARDKKDTSMIPLKEERMLREVNKKLQLAVSQLQEERDEALRLTRDERDARSIPITRERSKKAAKVSYDRHAFEDEKRELQERVDRTKQLLESFVKLKNSENVSAMNGSGGGDDESTPDERIRSTTFRQDSDFFFDEAKTPDTGLWSSAHDQHRMDRTELVAATAGNKSISGGFEFATPRLSVRAEEIAACMALSARQSFNHNIESGQEQDLTISALRRKVKLLENALVFRGAGR